MADPMTAREALSLALGYASEGVSGPETRAEFARARNILEALVEAHEADVSGYEDSEPETMGRLAEAAYVTYQRVRSLERGEEAHNG